jgi:osmotically-inducible protein OsmY
MLLGAACARPPVTGPPGATFDRQLRELVELRLSSDRRLCPFAIQVVVYNGTVELAGLVDGPIEQRRAEEIARAAGAVRVVDHLQRSLGSGDAGRC